MSIYQIIRVWEHEFDHPEQSIMIALADHADENGEHIFPGVHRIAWKTDYEERQVRRIIAGLKDKGILVLVAPHTPYRPAEYKINWNRAKRKPDYVPPRMSGVTSFTPDIEGSTPDIAMSTDPSLETSSIPVASAPGDSSFKEPPAKKYNSGKEPISYECSGNPSPKQPAVAYRCECGTYVNSATNDECVDCGQRYIWQNCWAAKQREKRRKKDESDARAKKDKALVRVLEISSQFPPMKAPNMFNFQNTIKATRIKMDVSGDGLIALAERMRDIALSDQKRWTQDAFLSWLANTYAKHGPDAYMPKSASQVEVTSKWDGQL